jgi:hypothetical protein
VQIDVEKSPLQHRRRSSFNGVRAGRATATVVLAAALFVPASPAFADDGPIPPAPSDALSQDAPAAVQGVLVPLYPGAAQSPEASAPGSSPGQDGSTTGSDSVQSGGASEVSAVTSTGEAGGAGAVVPGTQAADAGATDSSATAPPSDLVAGSSPVISPSTPAGDTSAADAAPAVGTPNAAHDGTQYQQNSPQYQPPAITTSQSPSPAETSDGPAPASVPSSGQNAPENWSWYWFWICSDTAVASLPESPPPDASTWTWIWVWQTQCAATPSSQAGSPAPQTATQSTQEAASSPAAQPVSAATTAQSTVTDGSGTQVTEPSGGNQQQLAAGAQTTQTAPQNVNVSVRVLSPGDEGPVSQSNSVSSDATAANADSTTQAASSTSPVTSSAASQVTEQGSNVQTAAAPPETPQQLPVDQNGTTPTPSSVGDGSPPQTAAMPSVLPTTTTTAPAQTSDPDTATVPIPIPFSPWVLAPSPSPVLPASTWVLVGGSVPGIPDVAVPIVVPEIDVPMLTPAPLPLIPPGPERRLAPPRPLLRSHLRYFAAESSSVVAVERLANGMSSRRASGDGKKKRGQSPSPPRTPETPNDASASGVSGGIGVALLAFFAALMAACLLIPPWRSWRVLLNRDEPHVRPRPKQRDRPG